MNEVAWDNSLLGSEGLLTIFETMHRWGETNNIEIEGIKPISVTPVEEIWDILISSEESIHTLDISELEITLEEAIKKFKKNKTVCLGISEIFTICKRAAVKLRLQILSRKR